MSASSHILPPLVVNPISFELLPAPDVEDAFLRFKHLPGCLLLDSSMQIKTANDQPLGRYSFLMADPFESLECEVGETNPFSQIRKTLSQFQICPDRELPPLQGGIAGLLTYDLNRSLEKIAPNKIDDFQLPALVMGCYDALIAWNHDKGRAWIVSTGLPEIDDESRSTKANQRIEEIKSQLQTPVANCSITQNRGIDFQPVTTSTDDHAFNPGEQFPVDGPAGLLSNFSKERYIEAVQKCIDYIYAGDVFQINFAQRLLFPAHDHASELYRRLRRCNPAPFGGYFDISGISQTNAQIVSASPERFFSVRDRRVETRPIKGTRRRTRSPLVDLHAKSQLESSVKDRAENTMIVDLMRNDLARCCRDDSIQVTQLCALEEYQSVLHLVSAVEGELKPEYDLVDLLESIFPGGSITGAPKVRAMEIISEIEPHTRGAYCGALGYLGFDGCADFSILIRTMTATGGWLQIPVGGGIVSQSDPQREYEETWTKAAGMLRALQD